MRITTNLQERLPFISAVSHAGVEYVGIIINQDSRVTSMYNFETIRTDEEKGRFLELGEIWWWESNREIPINIFLNYEIAHFKYAIKNFHTKDVSVLFGPVTSLDEMLNRRVKRKSILIARRPKFD